MDTRLVTGARDSRSRARGARVDSPRYGNLRGAWPWLPCPHPPQHSGAKGQHRARSGAMARPQGCPVHPLTEEGNRSSAQVPARTASPIAGPTDTADQEAEQRVWGLHSPQGEHSDGKHCPEKEQNRPVMEASPDPAREPGPVLGCLSTPPSSPGLRAEAPPLSGSGRLSPESAVSPLFSSTLSPLKPGGRGEGGDKDHPLCYWWEN